MFGTRTRLDLVCLKRQTDKARVNGFETQFQIDNVYSSLKTGVSVRFS